MLAMTKMKENSYTSSIAALYKNNKTTVLKSHLHSHNLHTLFKQKVYLVCVYILYIFIYF